MARIDPHTIGITRESRIAQRQAASDQRLGVLERRGGGGSGGGGSSGLNGEQVDDRVAGLLTAGDNVILTYSDPGGTLTIDADIDSWSVSKGDLFVATGLGTAVRLPVGTDGQVLVADSTAAAGVKWATVDISSGTVFSFTNDETVTTMDCNATTITEMANVFATFVRAFPIPPSFSFTNRTTDKSYNANATTINELADVLATMITDLNTSVVGIYTVTNDLELRTMNCDSISLDLFADILATFISDMQIEGNLA